MKRHLKDMLLLLWLFLMLPTIVLLADHKVFPMRLRGGQVLGGLTAIQTPVGATLHFDGTNGMAHSASAFHLSARPFTIAYWAYVITYTSGLESELSDLDNDIVGITAGAADKFLLWSFGSYCLSTNTIVVSQWHHIAAVNDGIATWTFYIDGTPNSTKDGSIAPVDHASDYGITFGSLASGQRFLNGSIMTP